MSSADYQAIVVPQGSGWNDVERPFALPDAVAGALDRARGALVRTVYRLRSGSAELVALGYHRPGTAQEKLTALSGDADLLADLIQRLAEQLAQAGVVSLKVEVPAEAHRWQQAAEEAGLVRLRTPVAAGAPGASAAPVAGFVARLGDWSAVELPYYRQSTEFTCGPVAALTAASELGAVPQLDRTAELQFWREATSAPGCDGYGLAAALGARDVRSRLLVNGTAALQVETTPAPWQVDLREFTQQQFRADLDRFGVPVEVGEPRLADVLDGVGSEHLALLLIDEAEMHGEACPHWVVAHGTLPGVVLIEDPWTDEDLGESWVDAHQLPVRLDALERMSGWGDYRSLVVLPATASR